jgi:hypothetical protein
MYIFKSKNVNALLMKCLKIPKEISEAVFRRTDNTMAKNTNNGHNTMAKNTNNGQNTMAKNTNNSQLNATQKTNN